MLPSFLKKIPFVSKLFLKTRPEGEYFLSLLIKATQVKTAVWRKDKEKNFLVNLGKADYHGDWEETIKAADEAIVGASADVSQEEIEKVIFGIPQDWTSENKILEPHLSDLKKLCAQLSLKPLGFVVGAEAAVDYLRQIEGIPPTALLVELKDEFLTLVLVKAGRIEGLKAIKREGDKDLPLQIEKTLVDFQAEILPARILLYNGGEDLEELKSDLLSYHFSDKLPFLHLPKIEILDKDFDIKSLVTTSGARMGGEFSEEILGKKEKVTKEKAIEEEPVGEEEDSLGFVKDKDILEKEEDEQPPKLEENQEEEPVSSRPPLAAGASLLKSFSLPSLKLPRLTLPKINLAFLAGFKWFALILILIMVALGGAIFAAYWYLPKAEVTIWVAAKPLEKAADITVSPSLKENEAGPEFLLAKTVEVEEKKSGKTLTTGKKKVGDPAKGKIIIYNKAENNKTFPSGTVLLGLNDLNFTLDSDVKVASTPAFSTTLSSAPGTVTAVKIGPEGNLSSGTNFSFKDYPSSSYFAKSDGDLSGGTSREISVVAKSDQERLLSSLTADFTGKAKDDLRGKLGSDDKLLEETIIASVKEKKFDKDINDETSELNLTLTMTFKATSYNEKDLKEKLLQTLEVPQGYGLDRDGAQLNILNVKTKDKEQTAHLQVVLKANLLPKLDPEEIRKKITGKNQSAAEDYLKGLGSVSQIKISIRFPLSLPLPQGTLPRSPKNIKIDVISR